MIFKTSVNCLTNRSHKVCATAVLASTLIGTGFGFPPFTTGARNQGPIHRAAIRGDTVRLVETIRQNPGAVSAVDAMGNTALHLAASHDHVEATRVLLRAGASVNAANTLGMTPLMLAAKRGNSKIVNVLLQNHADAKIRDAHGWTALNWAKKTHHYESAILIALAAPQQ
jgi:ankyrin repeat protein